MPAMDHYTEPRVSAKKSTRPPFQKFMFVAFTAVAFIYGWLLYSAWTWNGPSLPPVEKAVVILSGPSNVTGTVTFYQTKGRGAVVVHGHIQNMDFNALRGLHVHQSGDLTNGCLSAGSHFNPFKKPHGAPTDKNRHVGDLGNIESDASGSAVFSLTDSRLSLNGPLSIVGRAVVVHAGTDDLGKGGDEESLKTGNAGARSACGVVGVVV